jgi:hypothetical protein
MNYDAAMELLFDNSGLLRKLAQLSGFREFSFYNGASPVGLRLNGQDLRGLNFENADLRGADLEGVVFDPGAFNGAKLSSYAQSLKDDFEFYVEDIAIIRFASVYFYARFRPGSLDHAIASTGMTYRDFSLAAKISLQTLRKARRGQVVSCETTFQIAISLSRIWRESVTDDDNQLRLLEDSLKEIARNNQVRQPLIELLDLKRSGKFEKISRSEFVNSLEDQLLSAKALIGLVDLEQLVIENHVKSEGQYRTSKDIFS